MSIKVDGKKIILQGNLSFRKRWGDVETQTRIGDINLEDLLEWHLPAIDHDDGDDSVWLYGRVEITIKLFDARGEINIGSLAEGEGGGGKA